MPMQVSGQTGEAVAADGVQLPFRQGQQGDQIVSQLHGRYYEANLRGRLYRGGMALTAITNATFTVATLGATCTPIMGVWNPLSSKVNLVMLKAFLGLAITAATNTGCGGFQWAVGKTERALTLGGAPFNCLTLDASGSVAKNMAGIALTGLVTNLVLAGASALNGGSAANFSFVGTAVGQATAAAMAEENLDGAWIIPPGGILALLCGTTPVAHSAMSGLLWEEVPIK